MKHSLVLVLLFFSIVAEAQETESSGRGLEKGQYIIGLYGSGGLNNSPIYKPHLVIISLGGLLCGP